MSELPAASKSLQRTESHLLWTPSSPSTTQTSLFRESINTKYSLNLSTYSDLWEWSISHRAEFWSELWDWENVIGTKGPAPYVDEEATPEGNPWWFEGAEVNWAENQLRHHKSNPGDVAVIQISERCEGYEPGKRVVSWRELYGLVGRAQRAMKREGVVKGDTVAFWGGNCLVSRRHVLPRAGAEPD
jgi:acetoacetyl-CoA synthetase